MAITTIQEGVAGAVVPDNYLDSNFPTDTSGALSTVQIGFQMGKVTAALRTILEFDLTTAGIPSGAIVSAASLVLNVSLAAAIAEPVRVHRLTRTDWEELTSSWDNYKTATPWTTGGGDFNALTFASANLPTGTGDWTISAGLAVLVQDAIDNRSGILRLMIKRFTEATTEAFVNVRSGEYATVADRPELSVTYTTEITIPIAMHHYKQLMGAN